MIIYIVFRIGLVAAVAMVIEGCGSSLRAVSAISASKPAYSSELVAQMFEERCQSAGEKIHKTIDNVDGIFLLKMRPEKINFSNQYELDDPYGRDFNGDAYIRSFLRGFYKNNYGVPDNPKPDAPLHLGYRYVDAVDKNDGERYRYTAVIDQPGLVDPSYAKDYQRFVLKRSVAMAPAPRYGVTYDDISTKDDRDHWIAGSSLKVIDLKTNEILAERIGYMYDPQQGASAGGRAPWLIAANYSCPSFGTRHGSSSQARQSETFVGKVLRPSK